MSTQAPSLSTLERNRALLVVCVILASASLTTGWMFHAHLGVLTGAALLLAVTAAAPVAFVRGRI